MNDIIPQTEKKSSNNVQKKRNWTFVLYPESAPGDWIERLKKTGLQGAISPLHDSDFSADKQQKKPHHHIVICYSGPTSYNVVLENLTKPLNATIPQPVEQVRGLYRYLTHKDDPDKAQYSESDIIHLNGFNVRDFIEISKSEKLEIIITIQNLIRKKNITEYADLLDLLLDEYSIEMYDIAVNNTIMLRAYLSSKRHKSEFKTTKNDIKNLAKGALK